MFCYFLTENYHVKILFMYVKYFLLVDSVGISESITTGSTRGKGTCILNMKLCSIIA